MNKQIDINSKSIVKEIVVKNYQTAKVFEKYGIDFCHRGDSPLYIAVEKIEINITELIDELVNTSKIEDATDERYDEWNLSFLSQYIVNNHHAYIKQAVPRINELLSKIENRHGDKHTHIFTVNKLFQKISNGMINHMLKEEKYLFPHFKYLEDCRFFNERPKMSRYETIKKSIQIMEQEHLGAGNIVAEIKNVTSNYILPVDACATFTLTYKELEEFEKNLRKHVHLENNILFPKAIKLEEDLLNHK